MTTVLSGAQVSPSGYPGPQGTVRLPADYLSGFTYTLSGVDTVNDIGISLGACRDSTNQYDIVLPAALNKQTDALWAAGTNQGGRDTGATANGTWHTFAILNPTTSAVDVLFSLSLTAPTLPSGYTAFRRIFSLVRAAGAIVEYRQLGDYFQITNPQVDTSDAQPAPAQIFGVTFGLIPKGFRVLVHANFRGHSSGGAAQFCIREPDVSFVGIGELWCPVANASSGATLDVWTGITGQITITYLTGPATAHFFAQALGFWDYRGKNGII